MIVAGSGNAEDPFCYAINQGGDWMATGLDWVIRMPENPQKEVNEEKKPSSKGNVVAIILIIVCLIIIALAYVFIKSDFSGE